VCDLDPEYLNEVKSFKIDTASMSEGWLEGGPEQRWRCQSFRVEDIFEDLPKESQNLQQFHLQVAITRADSP
jgi:hypothetical protein